MMQIDQEHFEYKRQAAMWRVYRDLYAGGHQFKMHAADYLLPRQKEPLDVYGERLQRVFYENYIGSIVDCANHDASRRVLLDVPARPSIRYPFPAASAKTRVPPRERGR